MLHHTAHTANTLRYNSCRPAAGGRLDVAP